MTKTKQQSKSCTEMMLYGIFTGEIFLNLFLGSGLNSYLETTLHTTAQTFNVFIVVAAAFIVLLYSVWGKGSVSRLRYDFSALTAIIGFVIIGARNDNEILILLGYLGLFFAIARGVSQDLRHPFDSVIIPLERWGVRCAKKSRVLVKSI